MSFCRQECVVGTKHRFFVEDPTTCDLPRSSRSIGFQRADDRRIAQRARQSLEFVVNRKSKKKHEKDKAMLSCEHLLPITDPGPRGPTFSCHDIRPSVRSFFELAGLCWADRWSSSVRGRIADLGNARSFDFGGLAGGPRGPPRVSTSAQPPEPRRCGPVPAPSTTRRCARAVPLMLPCRRVSEAAVLGVDYRCAVAARTIRRKESIAGFEGDLAAASPGLDRQVSAQPPSEGDDSCEPACPGGSAQYTPSQSSLAQISTRHTS